MSKRAVQAREVVATPPPTRKRGRPQVYGALLRAVQEDFAPRQWVRLTTFSDPSSARVAVKKIRNGERAVPGGQEVWDLQACVEEVEVKGGGRVRGSVLYVRWVPERRMGRPVEGGAAPWPRQLQ